MAALALGALLGLFVALWDPLGTLVGEWVHLWVQMSAFVSPGGCTCGSIGCTHLGSITVQPGCRTHAEPLSPALSTHWPRTVYYSIDCAHTPLTQGYKVLQYLLTNICSAQHTLWQSSSQIKMCVTLITGPILLHTRWLF